MSLDKIVSSIVKGLCERLLGKLLQSAVYAGGGIIGGVMMIPWYHLFIGVCFSLPIIIHLIDIRRKINEGADVKGKLVFRGFNFSFDNAGNKSMKMSMQVILFNCSHSIIYFRITDKTATTIKEHVSNISKVKGQLENLKGFVLPHQEINVNLPIIENIPTDPILKASANIVCEYGEFEVALNNIVEWALDDIELEKTENKGYNKKSGKLSKVEYR